MPCPLNVAFPEYFRSPVCGYSSSLSCARFPLREDMRVKGSGFQGLIRWLAYPECSTTGNMARVPND